MIDFTSIAESILEAATEALGAGAQQVAALARAKAPVRKVFAAGASVNPRSAGGMQRSSAPTGSAPSFASLGRKEPPVHWRERRLATAAGLLSDYDAGDRSTLSRRGAYEIRQALSHPKPGSRSPTGRLSPAFATWQHVHVGGRLRGEIRATPVSRSGNRAEAWVISPTPYAKYQEFGTRHNAAHPFLRPATAESRAEIVSRIASAVAEAARTGGQSSEIVIEVRL